MSGGKHAVTASNQSQPSCLERWLRPLTQVLYLLAAVESTAQQTIRTVADIKAALLHAKHRMRAGFRFYSQDLIINLFMHPYTKIEFVERDLKVSRLTATKYLDALAAAGFVLKMKTGRSNYYINVALNAILTRGQEQAGTSP